MLAGDLAQELPELGRLAEGAGATSTPSALVAALRLAGDLDPARRGGAARWSRRRRCWRPARPGGRHSVLAGDLAQELQELGLRAEGGGNLDAERTA